MKKSSQLISAIMTLVLGILFVILKAQVIGVCLTLLGIALIVIGVLDIIRKSITSGVVKTVLGIAVLVVGWWLLEIAVLVIGIILAVYGVIDLIKAIIALVKNKEQKLFSRILNLIAPILCIIAAAFLLTNGGVIYDWAIIVAGIFFIVDGVIALIGALSDK